MTQLPRFLTKNMYLAQNYWKLCKNRATQKWFHAEKGPYVKILPFVKTPLLHTRNFWTIVHFKITIVCKVFLWTRVDSLWISLNICSSFGISLKKKKIAETSDGFKKTVENQKYTGTLMNKLVKLHNFLVQLHNFFITVQGYFDFEQFFWNLAWFQ